MTLEELIQIHKEKLTQTEWAIYNSAQEVSMKNISIQEFAQRNHVSTTTIIRFCKKIGLSGFSELKVIQKTNTKSHLSRSQLPSLYHEIVDYIERVELSRLREALEKSDSVFIYASSELELRVAREMQRIFFPLNKSMFILPNKPSLQHSFDKINQQVLVVIIIDSNDVPIDLYQKQEYYSLLFGPVQYMPVVADEQILIPTLSHKGDLFKIPVITPFILALELLYLKLQLS